MSISPERIIEMVICPWIYKLGVLLTLLFSISGCIESSFKLADESRIPSGFNIPVGLTRNDLSVTLDFYTSGSAVFKLYQKGSFHVLDEITGIMRDKTALEQDGTTWPVGQMPNFPLYQVIMFQGYAEIIEQKKMEPVFYISDDPEIIRVLGCSKSAKNVYKCRKFEITE